MVLATLWDGFETMVMTRNITRDLRLTRILYFITRPSYFSFASRIRKSKAKARPTPYLPARLSHRIDCGLGNLDHPRIRFDPVRIRNQAQWRRLDLPTSFYFSGITFLTVGYGDFAPIGALGRTLSVIEAGCGLVFLAGVIGYLPVIYGSVQRREILITWLDSRASSNPTASN